MSCVAINTSFLSPGARARMEDLILCCWVNEVHMFEILEKTFWRGGKSQLGEMMFLGKPVMEFIVRWKGNAILDYVLDLGYFKDTSIDVLLLVLTKCDVAFIKRLVQKSNLMRPFSTPNKSSTSIIHLAIKSFRAEVLEVLLEFENLRDVVSIQDGTGSTPLHLISKVFYGHYDPSKCHTSFLSVLRKCVDFQTRLMEAGCDPNSVDKDGKTALCLMLNRRSSEGMYGGVINLLIWGANPGLANSKEKVVSPLQLACVYGHLEIIKILVEFGADPNQELAETGQTPIIMAAMMKRFDVCSALIQLGVPRESNVQGLRQAADFITGKSEKAKFAALKTGVPSLRSLAARSMRVHEVSIPLSVLKMMM